MPLFNNEDMDIRQIPGPGSMSYSATRVNDVENVGASCITLVTIAIDRSGSVRPFASVLVDMLKVIIEASSNPGDLVLDCFCGSGTTLAAAQEIGRQWIGIDNSKIAIKICKERLDGIKQLNIFGIK